jgi:multiple sugar transport system permease protein
MISSAIFFNMVLGIIGALKVFALAFVGTDGGPGWSTTFYALWLYSQAFRYFRMGYGSALAWLLALILFGLTYLQLTISNRWVYYGGENE